MVRCASLAVKASRNGWTSPYCRNRSAHTRRHAIQRYSACATMSWRSTNRFPRKPANRTSLLDVGIR